MRLCEGNGGFSDMLFASIFKKADDKRIRRFGISREEKFKSMEKTVTSFSLRMAAEHDGEMRTQLNTIVDRTTNPEAA